MKTINIADFDHIISHFDGNNNDNDDIAALPMAAALTNAAGLQNKSTFLYNNNLGEPNNPRQVDLMRQSATIAEKLGIDVYDYQANAQQATARVVEIINSGQKVLAIEGGPMEAIYRALEQVSPQNRKNVTLLSHSGWNENRNVATKPGVNDVRTWSDIKSRFPEVELVEINDQNGVGDKGFKSAKWSWLDNTNNPVLAETRRLMKNAYSFNDPSDAGMHFYALTGNQYGDPNDAKAFFQQNPPSFTPVSNPNPMPAPNGSITVEAESMQLSGEYRVEANTAASGGQDISLRGGATEGAGAAKFNFNGPAGKYNVKIHYFDENDGIGQLRLKQGNQQIASFNLDKQLGSALADAKTRTSTELKGVSIQAGETMNL